MPLKLLASLYGLFFPAGFYKPLIDIVEEEKKL